MEHGIFDVLDIDRPDYGSIGGGKWQRLGDYSAEFFQEQEDSLSERFGHDVNRIMYGVRYPGVCFKCYVIILFTIFFLSFLFFLASFSVLGLVYTLRL